MVRTLTNQWCAGSYRIYWQKELSKTDLNLSVEICWSLKTNSAIRTKQDGPKHECENMLVLEGGPYLWLCCSMVLSPTAKIFTKLSWTLIVCTVLLSAPAPIFTKPSWILVLCTVLRWARQRFQFRRGWWNTKRTVGRTRTLTVLLYGAVPNCKDLHKTVLIFDCVYCVAVGSTAISISTRLMKHQAHSRANEAQDRARTARMAPKRIYKANKVED